MAGALLLAPALRAQFSLSGEFRPRTELSRGYSTLASDGQKASVFTSQRTRLNAVFKNEFIQTSLVLQDVRLWGGQPQLVTNEDCRIAARRLGRNPLHTCFLAESRQAGT